MEPLLHFSLAFAVLCAFGVEPGVAFPASLFALSPDLDVLLGVHRWVFHSFLVLAAVGLPIVACLRRTGFGKFASLALLAALSHPVLDLFSGYTPILWPVWGRSVWISLEASLRGGSLGLEHSFRVLTEPTRFEHLSSFHAPLLTGDGLIISAVLVLPALMVGIRMRKHGATCHTPETGGRALGGAQ